MFAIYTYLCIYPNKEAALFQTVKELVENSIDAAGPLDGRHCELAVNIYRAIEERQQCVVEVLDNGQGMSNPRAQLNCFHSDKAPNSLARVSSHGNAADRTHRSLSSSAGEMGALSCGKFGVGLSTCILCK
jgi:sensor histidine kinase regulating citrate/malate metabolism